MASQPKDIHIRMSFLFHAISLFWASLMRHEPLLSIVSLAYNHELYIAQALESFLLQTTSFPVEIVVGEDCSKDGTRDICMHYVKQYPGKIRVITSERNVGPHDNFRRTVLAARGTYIALCDADDYWTDPNKLQKQVDFLEANPEYRLCYTNARELNQRTNTFSPTVLGQSHSSLEDLLLTNNVPTMTAVFRKSMYDAFVSEIFPHSANWKMGDYPLWLFIAAKSKVKLLDGITATYRVLEESASRSKNIDHYVDFVSSAFTVKNFFADRFHVSDETRKQYTLKYFCDILYWAFFVDRVELIEQAKSFFETNDLIILRSILAGFTIFKNNRFALKVLKRFMEQYTLSSQ